MWTDDGIKSCPNCCRHSLVDLSAPTILLPRVQVPSTSSKLVSFIVIFEHKRRKINKRRPGLAHFLRIAQSCPKCSHSLSKSPKKSPNIWANYWSKFVSKIFQKSPHLVTLFLNMKKVVKAARPFSSTASLSYSWRRKIWHLAQRNLFLPK